MKSPQHPSPGTGRRAAAVAGAGVPGGALPPAAQGEEPLVPRRGGGAPALHRRRPLPGALPPSADHSITSARGWGMPPPHLHCSSIRKPSSGRRLFLRRSRGQGQIPPSPIPLRVCGLVFSCFDQNMALNGLFCFFLGFVLRNDRFPSLSR